MMTVFWDDVIVLSIIVIIDVKLYFLKKEHNYCNFTLVVLFRPWSLKKLYFTTKK